MQLFVWDFHGVLEKDNEKAVIDISNQVLKQAGYKERFTDADNHKLYGSKWYQYFEYLLPELGKKAHMALQAACFKFEDDNPEALQKHIKANDYAVEVLTKIGQSDNQQIVISNTRPADLVWFLQSVGLKQFFDDAHIIGVNAHQTHGSKAEALKSHLQDKHFDKIIVIGDSEGDLKLGKDVGATTYFYRHAYRDHEDTQNADHIIRDLRAVLDELNA